MRPVTIAVVLALLCGMFCCKEHDPYRELLLDESFGLGTPLGSEYRSVEERIAESLGQRIADNNVSRDPRYLEFKDVYGNYSFIVGDINQDNEVDVIMIVINDELNNEYFASQFSSEFPNVRTKTGVSLGTSTREVIRYYKFEETGTRGMLIETHDRHLLFSVKGLMVVGLQLSDDFAFNMPIFTLKGRHQPEF